LRSLYLLTIADISTTAPTSMTSWKSRMLDELYALTQERLVGTLQCDPLRRAQAEARAYASQQRGAVDPAFFEEFLSSMPERYVLSNAPAEIVAHARVAQAARGRALYLQLVTSRHAGVAELCVVISGSGDARTYGPDRPGLLAAMASAFTACRLEIHAAQIYTRALPDGSEQVLDVFWVRDRVYGLDGVEPALPKFEETLRELIAGKVTPAQLLQQRAPTRWSDRPCPAVPTEVAIDNRSSSRYTIIEVIAQDRPGVLFRLAHTLSVLGLTIAFAKVNTEGNRVVDIFYVTELDESKVGSRARSQQIEQQLMAALQVHAPARLTVSA
jgi:[protein-PII] uridylyltransferase